LHYTNVVSFNGNKLRTTIGGTGLAVSAFSQHKETAIDFAAMISGGRWQRTMYVQNGGQPAHRSAWMDESANYLTNNFFKIVLPIMENGYLRPRYHGYLHFQDHAGEPLHKCLIAGGNPEETLKEINKLYRQSIAVKKSTVDV
jgi:multiple sugar transport system substrate-binding protein